MGRFTLETARMYLRAIVVGIKPETLEKAAAIMVADDVCAWHAFSQVSGKPCWCSECRPDVKRIA